MGALVWDYSHFWLSLLFREKFWQQDQEAEKGRILAERERRESEQKISEQKRIAREEQERQQRDEAIKEKERKISVLREQEASTQVWWLENSRKKTSDYWPY